MSAAELNTEKILTDLKRIVADSEELLQATKGTAGDKAHEIRERLSQALEAAKRTCRRLEDKAIAGAKVADQTIRDHPYQSMGRRLRHRPADWRAGQQKVSWADAG